MGQVVALVMAPGMAPGICQVTDLVMGLVTDLVMDLVTDLVMDQGAVPLLVAVPAAKSTHR